jgi:hypothetical protein
MRFYLIWENKRRDIVEQSSDGFEEDSEDVRLLDLTDRQIVGYRYVY